MVLLAMPPRLPVSRSSVELGSLRPKSRGVLRAGTPLPPPPLLPERPRSVRWNSDPLVSSLNLVRSADSLGIWPSGFADPEHDDAMPLPKGPKRRADLLSRSGSVTLPAVATRAEALRVQGTLDVALCEAGDDLLRQAEAWDAALLALGQQVYSHCAERGALLERARRQVGVWLNELTTAREELAAAVEKGLALERREAEQQESRLQELLESSRVLQHKNTVRPAIGGSGPQPHPTPRGIRPSGIEPAALQRARGT